MILRPPTCTLFPYSTLFRSSPYPLLARGERDRRRGRADGKGRALRVHHRDRRVPSVVPDGRGPADVLRSEEHTSELQSRQYLVCRLLLEKKNKPMRLSHQ